MDERNLAAAAEPAEEEEEKKRRKPLAIWIVAAAALLAAVALAAVLFGFLGGDSWYDEGAGDGMEGLGRQDIEAALNAKVEEGMMNVTVLSPMKFPDGSTSPGLAGFNNLEQNHFDQKLTITLDDSGEVVYESGAIAPGQNLAYITLNRELPDGEHAATAKVTGYDSETHEEVGAVNAAVVIKVGADG